MRCNSMTSSLATVSITTLLMPIRLFYFLESQEYSHWHACLHAIDQSKSVSSGIMLCEKIPLWWHKGVLVKQTTMQYTFQVYFILCLLDEWHFTMHSYIISLFIPKIYSVRLEIFIYLLLGR